MKKLFYSLLSTFLLSFNFSQAQYNDYIVYNAGGAANDQYSCHVIDKEDNHILTGSFDFSGTETIDLDPSSGVSNYTYTDRTTGVITKLDYNGNLKWIKVLEAGTVNSQVFPLKAKTDANGNVFVVGYFTGTADFDPGSGTSTYNSFNGFEDMFLVKLDPDGNFLWDAVFRRTNTTAGANTAYSLDFDADGKIYVVGQYFGNVDFDPSPTTNYFTTASSRDGYVVKLDENGNFIKHLRLSNISLNTSETIVDVSFNPIANVFVVSGYYSSGANFNPHGTTVNLPTTGAYINAFIAQYDTALVLTWAKALSTNDNSGAYELEHDVAGNVYVAGLFKGTMDADPSGSTANLTYAGNSNEDFFFGSYDINGSYRWADRVGGLGVDVVRDIAVVGNKLYLTGRFESTVDFDPGPGGLNVNSLGNSDAFLLSVNTSDGSFNILQNVMLRYGSSGFDESFSVNCSEWDDYFLAGCFSGTVNFNQIGWATNRTSAGGTDAVFLGYSKCTLPGLVSTTDSSLCGTGSVTLLAADTTGTVRWFDAMTGGNLVDTGSIFNTPVIASTTTYYAEAYDGLCVAGSRIPVIATILPAPDVTVTYILDAMTVAESGATYQWVDCDNSFTPLSGETNQVITINGNYAVIVDNGSCIDTSACLVLSLGIDDYVNDNFMIYPNPSDGNFNITSNFEGEAELSIVDLRGNILMVKSITISGGNLLMQTDLPDGMYILQINCLSNVLHKPFIIQH